MDVFIRFTSGALTGRTEVRRILPGQRIWIGRTAKNEVQVPDPLVSGTHASLANEGGLLVIQDNASTNGLIAGGKQIERAAVRSGDRFILGWNGPELELVLREGAPPPAPAALAPAPAALAPAPRMCPQCGRPLYEAATCDACSRERGTVRSYKPQAASPQPQQPPPVPSPPPRPPTPPAAGAPVTPPGAPPGAPRRPPKAPPPAAPPTPRPPPPPPLTPEEQARRALEKEGLTVRERLPAPFGVLLFRCRRARSEEDVAVKVLLRHPEQETADEKRFLREARLAQRLKHPGVITVHDVRAGLDYMLIVFESLTGRTLAQEVQRSGPIPVPRALSIASRVARALVHMHGLGIVHRNICPESIMLTETDDVKLVDLGLLRVSGDNAEFADATLSGETLGSLGHIAPEQIAWAAQVDARADLYALGATLFHAIAGHAPHEPAGRLGEGEIAAAPRLGGAPPAVADVVARAMDPMPLRRYADAAEMLAAIDAAEHALYAGGHSPGGDGAAATPGEATEH